MSRLRCASLKIAAVLFAGGACSNLRYGGPAESPGVNWDTEAEGTAATAPSSEARGATTPQTPIATAKPALERRTSQHGTLPDPRPLALRRQWEYTVLSDRGTVRVEAVSERLFERPRETARQMGRYAIELWRGHELIERVRFDFPLLAAEPVAETGPKRLNAPPSFAAGSRLRRVVLVPASPRAARAVLVDRATGNALGLPWPPDARPAPAAATAR
jgi:hypothetical protein